MAVPGLILHQKSFGDRAARDDVGELIGPTVVLKLF